MKNGLALLSIAFLAGAAHAAPGDDPSKVQASLTSQGFGTWKRIEFDNGVWEVTDAVDASGKRFDLRVEAASMKVVSKIFCGPAN